jgi:hypothetical protein
MGKFALQISSYEIEKNNWLLLEVVVNKFSDIIDGYEATATWRDGSFYARVGDSANLKWKEENSLEDWQDKVNDVPTWPKLDEDDDTYWVAVAPIKKIKVGGEQKVMFITKKAGKTANAQMATTSTSETYETYDTPDVSEEEGCSSRDTQRLQKKSKKSKKTRQSKQTGKFKETKRSIKFNPKAKE